MLVFATDRRSW